MFLPASQDLGRRHHSKPPQLGCCAVDVVFRVGDGVDFFVLSDDGSLVQDCVPVNETTLFPSSACNSFIIIN